MSASYPMASTAANLTPSCFFCLCLTVLLHLFQPTATAVRKLSVCATSGWELGKTCRPQNVTCGLGGVAKVKASVRNRGEYS